MAAVQMYRTMTTQQAGELLGRHGSQLGNLGSHSLCIGIRWVDGHGPVTGACDGLLKQAARGNVPLPVGRRRTRIYRHLVRNCNAHRAHSGR